MPDFSPEDLQIRRAMLDVAPPRGGEQQLLAQLHAIQQDNPTESDSQTSRQTHQLAVASAIAVAQTTLQDSMVLKNSSASQSPSLAASTSVTATPVRTSRTQTRIRVGLIASAAVIFLAITLWWWQPRSSVNQLEWLVAQQIEQIEAKPITWQSPQNVPPYLRSMLAQVVTLEPLGFAKVKSEVAGENVWVYSFRNQEGKQILVFDMPGYPGREEFPAQLVPTNTSTGGWSFAVARTPRSLVVFAVPGNRQYLLRHMRNATVT